MKKVTLMIMTLFLLSACSNKNALQQEKLDLYQSYWTVIQDQETYQSESSNFTISASYDAGSYEVIIDQARVAMNSVQVLVVENDDAFQTEKMMPSAGIFEDPVVLIPNQSKPDSNFKAGIKLVGENTTPLKINVLVAWQSVGTSELHREFFEFTFE